MTNKTPQPVVTKTTLKNGRGQDLYELTVPKLGKMLVPADLLRAYNVAVPS